MKRGIDRFDGIDSKSPRSFIFATSDRMLDLGAGLHIYVGAVDNDDNY